MSIVSKIKALWNFTATWEDTSSGALTIDLDRHMLNGVRVNSPVENFRFLGPGKIRKDYATSVDYREKGLSLDTEDGVCYAIIVALSALDSSPALQDFGGTFVHRGQTLTLDEIDSKDKVLARLGSPYHEHADDSEIILFYEFPGGYEWNVEFHLDGRAKALLITSDPVLEDETQRECYGVQKPWPPYDA